MINFNRLKKEEILYLFNHYCKHKHRLTEHTACIEETLKDAINCPIIKEKIGFLDIETSNLSATFGFIFSYCIKELDGPIISRVLRPEELKKGIFDRDLMKQFLKDIPGFDRFVVYWGKDRRFDVPYLRSRALKWNVDFPSYREFFVTDCYDMVKAKMKLHRSSLQVACEFLDIDAKEHRMTPSVWQFAMTGDKKSLDHILTHNIEDVKSTEALWKRLEKFMRNSKVSI